MGGGGGGGGGEGDGEIFIFWDELAMNKTISGNNRERKFE